MGFSRKKGFMLIQVLIFSAVASILIGGILTWAANSIRNSRFVAEREQAFYIAEAGIEYYRWHLAHAQSDFQDGTATSGPYIHSFKDSSDVEIGNFSLVVTPPPTGSTLVTIVSTGKVNSNPLVSRSIEAKLAIPSLAKYAFVANTDMRFGEGTEIFGELHSNNGIRFDGVAHNLVSSAVASYNDPDHSGGNEYGVHTHVSPTDPLPPTAVPNRPTVFEAGRRFPVPAVDFNGFTTNLASMKANAQSGGRYLAPSADDGYQIILRTNDTMDVYRVNTLRNAPGGCTNSLSQTDWGTWSINTRTFIANYAFPANGVIFVEDDVWVEGQINTARLTIAAARFPETTDVKHIIVNNDLRYTNYDGQDVLSLVAQGDITIGLYSEDDLRVDAALLAKNGRVGRFYYDSDCSASYIRSVINLYGMLGSNQRYGFAYTDGTGYIGRIITYDANLLYAPPPQFPLSSDQYTTISWREL